MTAQPMTREQLHDIAVSRRGDADVKSLLLEIKRLHGVLVKAYELAGALPRTDGLNRDYTDQRLVELLGEEPAVNESHPPTRQAVNQETEGDRAAKRQARIERG